MALVKTKPTSAGRRSMVKVVNPDLHKGKPHYPLLEKQSKRAGRNSFGNTATRHQGAHRTCRLESGHALSRRDPRRRRSVRRVPATARTTRQRARLLPRLRRPLP